LEGIGMNYTQLCEECIEYVNNNTKTEIEKTGWTKGICPVCNNGNTRSFKVNGSETLHLNQHFLNNKLKLRPLSTRERGELPLELRCCFYLCKWNKSAEIKTVDNWVETFWTLFLPDGSLVGTGEILEIYGKKKARKEVDKLIGFASLIYDKGYVTAEKDTNERIKKVIEAKY
jgi:hypothetical protein